MKTRLYISILLIAVLSFSVIGFARDYFVMDFQNQTVQISSDDPATLPYYTNNANSYQVVPTANPDESIIIFTPFYYLSGENQTGSLNPQPENGKLILANKNGQTMQSFDLGFANFRKAVSADRKHILISYRLVSAKENYEVACFDVAQKNLVKLALNDIRNVYDIQFSSSSDTAYVLALDNDNNHVLITLSIAPFTIKSQYKIGLLGLPQNYETEIKPLSKIFVLNNNKLILLSYGGKNPHLNASSSTGPPATVCGSVYLFDSDKQYIIQQKELLDETFVNWMPELGRLLIASRSTNGKPTSTWEDVEWIGNGLFLKIDDQGMKANFTQAWFDYNYNPVKDQIYYLTNKEMNVYNFNDNTSLSWDIGRNTFSQKENIVLMTSPDLLHIENANLGFCWNMKNGKVRVIDLQNKKVIARLKGALFTNKSLSNKDGKTLIATNADQSRFYLMQSNSIQVYNSAFSELTKITLSKNMVGMYQLESPRVILAVARDKIYRIEDDKAILIHEFANPIIYVNLLRDGDKYILVTDKDWIELDPTSFNLKIVKALSGNFDDYVKIRYNVHAERRIQLRPTLRSEDT